MSPIQFVFNQKSFSSRFSIFTFNLVFMKASVSHIFKFIYLNQFSGYKQRLPAPTSSPALYGQEKQDHPGPPAHPHPHPLHKGHGHPPSQPDLHPLKAEDEGKSRSGAVSWLSFASGGHFGWQHRVSLLPAGGWGAREPAERETGTGRNRIVLPG